MSRKIKKNQEKSFEKRRKEHCFYALTCAHALKNIVILYNCNMYIQWYLSYQPGGMRIEKFSCYENKTLILAKWMAGMRVLPAKTLTPTILTSAKSHTGQIMITAKLSYRPCFHTSQALIPANLSYRPSSHIRQIPQFSYRPNSHTVQTLISAKLSYRPAGMGVFASKTLIPAKLSYRPNSHTGQNLKPVKLSYRPCSYTGQALIPAKL